MTFLDLPSFECGFDIIHVHVAILIDIKRIHGCPIFKLRLDIVCLGGISPGPIYRAVTERKRTVSLLTGIRRKDRQAQAWIESDSWMVPCIGESQCQAT